MTKYIWSQILISRGRTMCTNEHMIAAKPNSVNTWIYHQIHQQIWQLWTGYAYNMPTFINLYCKEGLGDIVKNVVLC